MKNLRPEINKKTRDYYRTEGYRVKNRSRRPTVSDTSHVIRSVFVI